MDTIFIDDFNNTSFFTRKDHIRGGSAICTSNDLKADDITYLIKCNSEINFELCATKFQLVNHKFILLAFYRSPRGDIHYFFEKLEEILSFLTRKYVNYNFLLTGDFNIDLGSDSQIKNQLLELLSTFGLRQTFFGMTRPFVPDGDEGTCIDNIFTDIPSSAISVTSHNLSHKISDHFVLIAKLKLLEPKLSDVKIPFRVFDPKSIKEFRLTLGNEFNKNAFFNAEAFYDHDTDTKFNYFHRIMINAFNCHFPKRLKCNNNKKSSRKWVSNEVSRSSEKCKDWAILSSQFPEEQRFKDYYNALFRNHQILVEEQKQKCLAERFAKSKNLVITSWQVVNENINNKFKNNNQISLIINGENVKNPTDIANHFAAKFSNDELPRLNRAPVILSYNLYPQFMFHDVMPHTVEKKIKACCVKRSSGYDEIPSNFLKNCADIISTPLAVIINKGFDEAVFPTNLKHSVIVPLHKKGAKSDINNFRPVSKQCGVSKVWECLMIDQLNQHLSEFKIVSTCQYAYQKGISTKHALFNMLNSIYGNLDSHLKTIGLIYDQSKAFELIEHSVMEAKLESYGIVGKALKFIMSFSQGRDFVVMVRNTEPTLGGHEHLSQSIPAVRGTQQGSAWGPKCFTLVNNDVRDALPEGELCVYADDTSHLLSDKSPNYDNITNICNTQVANMSKYCNDNCFLLNDKKCNYLIFHTVQSIVPEKLDIVINGKELTRATQIKMLGLIVTDTLCWEPHVNKVCAKLSSTCFLLSRLSEYCPEDILLNVYYAHMQSHVLYGQIFYGFATCAKRVLVLQKRAIRVICKASFLEHCKPLFVRTEILTFYSLLILEACCMVVQNPELFIKNTAIHNHFTRASNKVHVESVDLSLAQKGPHFACSKVYNHMEPFLTMFVSPRNVRTILKSVLCKFPFYSMAEFFETPCKEFIKYHKSTLRNG